MSAADHTPEQDQSFRRSLLGNVAGAVGLVVLVAGIFGVLGMIGRADGGNGDLAVDDGPDAAESDADPPDEDPAEADESDPDDASERDPAERADEDDETSGDPSEDDADVDDGDAEVDDGDAAADEDPDGDDPDTSEPETAPEPRIDPAEISVQVLDGLRADGGSAAGEVADQLADAGYRIVARNPAVAYERTTVLWTDGFEAEARQIAAEIDAAEVQEQPGNLSTAVNVHVVIGADRD